MPNNCHRCNRCGSRYNRSPQPTGFVRFREIAEQAVRSGRISVQERREIVEAYEAGLRF